MSLEKRRFLITSVLIKRHLNVGYYLISDSLYEGNGPIKFPVIKPEMGKPNPQVGLGMMAWSFDSNFLATRNGKRNQIIKTTCQLY